MYTSICFTDTIIDSLIYYSRYRYTDPSLSVSLSLSLSLGNCWTYRSRPPPPPPDIGRHRSNNCRPPKADLATALSANTSPHHQVQMLQLVEHIHDSIPLLLGSRPTLPRRMIVPMSWGPMSRPQTTTTLGAQWARHGNPVMSHRDGEQIDTRGHPCTRGIPVHQCVDKGVAPVLRPPLARAGALPGPPLPRHQEAMLMTETMATVVLPVGHNGVGQQLRPSATMRCDQPVPLSPAVLVAAAPGPVDGNSGEPVWREQEVRATVVLSHALVHPVHGKGGQGHVHPLASGDRVETGAMMAPRCTPAIPTRTPAAPPQPLVVAVRVALGRHRQHQRPRLGAGAVQAPAPPQPPIIYPRTSW
eukprot:TRINITY_DN1174_c0_g1_i3.p1 TRINITY_DN1174_c0_g1~~TRINITY_DN1174_c0_g1_i3.p1  ORF type:complete len:372 (+),score=-23.78 TRINITY_DN1174_c0_g1_i3:40-1116(+)